MNEHMDGLTCFSENIHNYNTFLKVITSNVCD